MRELARKLTKFFYNKLRYTIFIQSMEEELEIQSYSGVTSRHYEYPFGIGETLRISKKKKITKILDAGSFGSPFGPILAYLGFEVEGVDIMPWEIKFPRFKSKVADLKSLPYESGSFDHVTAISTIEHCGLTRFGENEDRSGDIKAVRELYRVLKPGRYCILTVPYAGRFRVFHNKHRVYDKRRFKKLIGNFKVVKRSFFAPIKNPGIFEPCSESEITKLNPYNGGTHGVICSVLIKK